MTVQADADARQCADVVLGVLQSAVGLLPLWPVEIQSAVYRERERVPEEKVNRSWNARDGTVDVCTRICTAQVLVR